MEWSGGLNEELNTVLFTYRITQQRITTLNEQKIKFKT